ncbi:MAG: ribonuclease [Oscillospiraceae bacterium]|nr:ribonuclease [Oscillospiraceae bacterium]
MSLRDRTVSTASSSTVSETETTTTAAETETTETSTETDTETETETETTEETTFTETTTSAATEENTVTETEAEKLSVEKDGSYTTPEDVAEYIHTFGTLPKNFITKAEAKELGWDNKKGNLWDVAEGKSIGGDYFGNYEGLLPKAKGRKYTECDVNYEGGYRGSERIIFSNDGLIYYTNDHYQTFTQLY